MGKWRDVILLAVVSVLSTLVLWLWAGMDTVYQNFDGPYYVAIAKTWYDQDLIRSMFSFDLPLEYYPAHLPFYPVLIALLGLTNLNYLQAMVGINVIAGAGLGITMFLISKKYGWKNPFWIGLFCLFFWPRMLSVRSVGSPEVIFILAVVMSMYFFDKKKYIAAAILGSVAILTKSPGVLLAIAYAVLAVWKWIETKNIPWQMWPLKLMGLAILGLYYFYYLKTGDFWAYFHTGDNIHLGLTPFRVFDSSQSWVGSFWLEDIIWIYLISGLGVFGAFKKNRTWGVFGGLFYLSLLFVSHRDISRYALPLVPVVAMGFSQLWDKKEVRWATVLIILPLLFYSANFIKYNLIGIGDWQPFL